MTVYVPIVLSNMTGVPWFAEGGGLTVVCSVPSHRCMHKRTCMKIRALSLRHYFPLA